MGELYCDICGKTPVRAQILLEGAKLLACGRCMKSGKIIHRFYEEGEERPVAAPRPGAMEQGEDIIEGFGRIIKEAREKAKIPIAVIAERISEKESYLTAIENERLKPTVAVAKKLEKELGVKLLEKAESSAAPSAAAAGKGFKEPTLADMLEEK